MGQAVGRVPGPGRQGGRHRGRARGHARAGVSGCDRRPHLPRRGPSDPRRVRAPPAPGCARADRRHPRGHGDRHQHGRHDRRCALGRADPRDRRPARRHDRRRDGGRSYPPHLEPDARQDPHHRGDQCRRELLGLAAHRQGQ